MILVEMLNQPFMVRALVAGAMLAALLASLGVFVTLRRMAFFGDGIAHASLAGIAIAVLAGLSPLPVALVWSVAIALVIWWLERRTRLPSDTVIGIFFTASLALGIILMSFSKGYQPELASYLFGSILAVRQSDAIVIAGLSAVIILWLMTYTRQLAYMSLAEENARVSGVNTAAQTAVLYVALAAATVLGVKILGIILISALLVLPPAAARMATRSFRGYVAGSIALAELMMVTGLAVSYAYDLPSGATVILAGTAIFFVAAALKRVLRIA